MLENEGELVSKYKKASSKITESSFNSQKALFSYFLPVRVMDGKPLIGKSPSPLPYCFFAIEITKIALSLDLKDKSDFEQMEMFSTLARLKLDSSVQTIGIRYFTKPSKDKTADKVRIFLLFKTNAPSLKEAEKSIEDLWQSVELCLSSLSGIYHFEVVCSEHLLTEIFDCEWNCFYEIKRHGNILSFDEKNRKNLIVPFVPVRNRLEKLLDSMLSSKIPVNFQIWFKPVSMGNAEIRALEENFNNSANSKLSNLSMETASILLKSQHDFIQQLEFNDLVEMRISLASDQKIPLALAHIAGQVLTMPFGKYDDLIAGGFEIFHINSSDLIFSQSVSKMEFVESENQMEKLSSIFPISEASGIWQFPLPNGSGIPGIERDPLRITPVGFEFPPDGASLGHSPFNENIVIKIGEKDRALHNYIVGQTGTGKTTYLKNLILHDLHQGNGIAVLDPHGDLIGEVLDFIPRERLDDVMIFNPSDTEYPMGLNLLEAKTPHERDFVIQEAIHIFYNLFDPHRTGMVGPQWEHWMRNAALTIMTSNEGGTLIDIPFLFTDQSFLDNKLKQQSIDPIARAFWEKQIKKTSDFHRSEMLNYFTSKFGRFLSNNAMRNIIGQVKSSFNLRKIMDQKQILLVNLSKGQIGEIYCEVLGKILVSKFFLAAASRIDTPKKDRCPFYLYVDEFQSFTTNTFSSILSEARKFRLSLTLAHQFTSQLPEELQAAVRGNVGSITSFRVGTEDAELLKYDFLPWFDVEDLKRLPNYHACIKMLIDGYPKPPVLMKVEKPNTEKADKAWREEIKQNSRKNWARNQKDVEAEIIERLGLLRSTDFDSEEDY